MNTLAYIQQRNYYILLIHENKKQYYCSLNVNRICDNINFWKVVKPHFSNIIVTNNKVMLRDNRKFI